ncbi:MAG: hypothetical protein L0H37_03095 [Nitrosospira sp.]|nr:hypothetical protein [Nitrosospira sp.]
MPTSKACLLLIMLLAPAVAHAAGLGRLTINSALGEPFNAEIDLIAVKKEEKTSLMARLASQDAFRQASVDYMPLFSTFKTSIENRSDGQAYVKVTSLQPITEPFLNMLIELNWSSGRLLREYTVLLAPPEIGAHLLATPTSQSSQSTAPGSANSSAFDAAVVENPGSTIKNPVIGEKAPVPGSASISKIPAVYGPVKGGDNLAEIGRNISASSGVSVNQMLVALYRANREAFFGDNMHRLKAGSILRVPDESEIGMMTPVEAEKEVRRQTVEWKRYMLLADVADLIPASEEPRQSNLQKGVETHEPDGVSATPPDSLAAMASQGELASEPVFTAQAAPLGAEADNVEDAMMAPPPTAGLATEIAKPMHVTEKSGHIANSPLRRNSLIDDLAANIEYLGGALVLLITSIVGISMVGRSKETSPDSSSVDVVSSVFDPQLPGKTVPVTTSAPMATSIPPGTDTAAQTDEADAAAAARAGVYLHTHDIQTRKVPKDTPVGNHDSRQTPANPQTPGIHGEPVNLTSSSEPIPSVFASPAPSAVHPAEIISFNLDDTQSVTPKEFTERSTQWHEIVTRLDLARAYQEMGDMDAARQVLKEAIREGDIQQQQSARMLLANL